MTRAATRPDLPMGLLFAVTATGMAANALITPVIPEILQGLDAAPRAAGWLVAASALPAIPLAPLLGLMADRCGRRAVLMVSAVLFAVTGGLAGLTSSLTGLLVLRGVQGVASVGLVNLVVILIADHRDGDERARLIGWNAAVQTIALVGFPIVGGALTGLAGWRAPFALYPLSLGLAVAIALRMPSTPVIRVSWGQQMRATLPAVREPNAVALLVTSTVVFVLIAGALWTVLPLYLAERFGVGPASRGLLLGLPALGSVAVSSNLHRLHRRYGRRRLLHAAATGLGCVLGLIALAPGLGLVAGGLLVLGLVTGATVPTLQDLAADGAAGQSRAAMVTTMVSAARLGQAAGPLIAAAALAAFGGTATLLAAAVTSVTVLPPLMRLSTTRQADPAAEPAAHLT